MRSFVGGASDVGRIRRQNEDYFQWWRPPEEAGAALYVVADGVGGQAAGEEASRLAVETFLAAYRAAAEPDPPARLRSAVARANAAVLESGARDGRASTLVAATCVDGLLHVVNVGDSRLYLVRGEAIAQITHDHSWVQEQVRAGQLDPAAAKGHPRGNVVTRWMGQPSLEPDLFALEVEPNDRIVICTDGLFKHVDEEAIRRVVQSRPEQAAADELVRLANEAGGTDNITVVVVRFADDSEPTAPEAAEPRADETLPGPAPARTDPAARGRPGRRRRQARAGLAWVLWLMLSLLLVGIALAGAVVLVVSADGTAPVPGAPIALAVAADGTTYVADQAAGEVLAYAPGALGGWRTRLLGARPTPIARWSAGEAGHPATSLTGLAVGPSGTVFVADGGSNRLRAFDPQGKLLAAWGETGAEPGRLNRPTALAVDADGSVYVADTGNRRVQSFTPTGALERVLAADGPAGDGPREAAGLAVDSRGTVYVADAGAARVLGFDPGGRLERVWGGPDSGQLVKPQGLAVDSAGALHVADAGAGRVQQLAGDSAPERVYQALWPTGASFEEPTAVALDQQGNLYVLDLRGGGIHVIRPRTLFAR